MGDTTPTADSADTTAGTTVITDSVIAKIAGIAARDVSGVHTLAGIAGVAGTLGAIREAMGGTDLAQGVSINVEDARVAVDIALVAEYPAPLHKVAADVRAAVIAAVESLAGMTVTAVNVTVKDVHLASDDSSDSQAGPSA